MLSSDAKERLSKIANWIFFLSGLSIMICLVFEFGIALSPRALYWARRIEAASLGFVDVGLFIRLLLGRWQARSIPAMIEIVVVTIMVGWAFLIGIHVLPNNTAAVLYARHFFFVYLFIRLAAFVMSGFEARISKGMRPAWIMLYSFGALIIAGTILLSMPTVLRENVKPWAFSEALLASTSAVCGTGISVRDVGSELSMRGQLVIFGLMQIGGLGLVTFVLFATYIKQRSLNVKQIVALREMMNLDMVGDLGRFLYFVLMSTVVVELAGAGLLYWEGWRSDLPSDERFWWCLFHSVSAFCNNGYSLSQDNMMSASRYPAVLATMSMLIVIGGIGYPVMYEAGHLFMEKLRARFSHRKTTGILRFSIHSKLMLIATAILLIGSTLFFLASEWSFTLKEVPLGHALTNSIFEATSARTAGFNSLDTSALQDSTYMLLILAMFIGAGPVSTAGGIKVTTFVVICLTVRSYLRNRDRIEINHRSLPASVTVISLSLLLIYTSLVVIFSTALMISQEQLNFRNAIFEIVSVMSSVGYSSGAVNHFSDFGRVIFCIATLVGRLGPLTLLLVISNRQTTYRYKYPQEGILLS